MTVPPSPAPKTNTSAVISLVTGILSLAACPFLAVVGLITGFIARREIRDSRGTETGEGLAMAGIITSAFGLVVVMVVVVAILAVTFLGRSTTSNVSSEGASPAPPGLSISGATPCPAADGTARRTTQFSEPPPMCIDATKTYTAKMTTSKGDLTITLDPEAAPLTTNNFVVLARYHYFDGLTFHRIIPKFVAQGGDPKGTGEGDPGYSFADELPSSGTAYQPGTVAMANAGPNDNGSQFFIVLAAGDFEPNYSVFGKVTTGYDTTVAAIAAVGTPSGRPTETVTIEQVTITES